MKSKSPEPSLRSSSGCGMEDILGLLDTTDPDLGKRARRICSAVCADGSSVLNSRPAEVLFRLSSEDNSRLSLEVEGSLWWHAREMKFAGSWSLSSSPMSLASVQDVGVTATPKER